MTFEGRFRRRCRPLFPASLKNDGYVLNLGKKRKKSRCRRLILCYIQIKRAAVTIRMFVDHFHNTRPMLSAIGFFRFNFHASGDFMAYNKNMKVLVVDDFPTMRRIIKNILRQLGINNISEAEDGVKAVAILEIDKFDLIISDWNMPNMTGIELLRHVRGSEHLKEIPFLMVTAEAQQENIIEAVKAKVSNYIVKPFTADTLNEKMEKIFS
jgi:two-component system chemotaxis response regulator CheY